MSEDTDPSLQPVDPGKELMLRVKAGDIAAFTLLVEAYQELVFRFVTRMVGGSSAVEAEDIAQQAFVRVWRSASRYEPSGKFTTWLFTVTRNLVINELRRRKRRPAVNLPDQPEEGRPGESWEGIPDPGARPPDELTLRGELEDAVDRAMESLPDNQRAALLLRRFENMAYEDIAATMGISLQSVKSLLFRARSHMKDALKGYLS